MTEHSNLRATPKNALGTIALFVSVIELAFAYPVTVLSGYTQLAFLCFMIIFPLLVFAGFFFVLMSRPENFYSPGDFSDPQAFSQLVARRDAALTHQLQLRTDKFFAVAELLQNQLQQNSDDLKRLRSKIDLLPELDRSTLEIDFLRTKDILEEVQRINRSIVNQHEAAFGRQLFQGITSIFFNAKALEGQWSLDFLMSVAVGAMGDIQKRQIAQIGGEGTVNVVDGDFVYCYTYTLSARKSQFGSMLVIAYDRSYYTTG